MVGTHDDATAGDGNQACKFRAIALQFTDSRMTATEVLSAGLYYGVSLLTTVCTVLLVPFTALCTTFLAVMAVFFATFLAVRTGPA